MIKKLLISGLFAIQGITVLAQDTNKVAPTADPKVLKAAATTDHAGEWMIMKKGKVYKIPDGKMLLVNTNITLDNGSILKPNGEVVTKDGAKVRIKEGEKINMLGDLVKVSDTTEKKVAKTPPPPAPVTK